MTGIVFSSLLVGDSLLQEPEDGSLVLCDVGGGTLGAISCVVLLVRGGRGIVGGKGRSYISDLIWAGLLVSGLEDARFSLL